ncbi:Endonuclease/exonuclease/phosphatase [Crenothrix polyspora]|uniref:Endonuclease/exonuclease/phosphatase n=1 Tax=Crenothrix polyspora TaxID=360316 RepID=A0A1R4H2M5_9GAMM|nr:endonuclease/exonuclease/phosphatase family protein [Crenothrix polyspora]SJM90473.1 Endonuclease/exonuclease/phosphatase [Crenothrix polyspora]
MEKIQLLYVKNIISKKKKLAQQTLTFFMRVEHVSYDKQVDVVWRSEGGTWQTLPATYHSKLDENKEYWCAEAIFHLTTEQPLPGNIEFGLRYQALDKDYWDNRDGLNYVSPAGSGVKLADDFQVLNIAVNDRLADGQKFFSVVVAVNNQSVQAQKVTIHWTTNNWQTVYETPCQLKKTYWHDKARSFVKNQNRQGVQIWQSLLNVNQAFRIQYCIACECEGQVLWDNQYGKNYSASHKPLAVMILNLHCYQEDNQDDKFSQIAKAIDDLAVDVVCFQEAAELWNDGAGDWNTNAAKIINDRLDKPYYIYANWSHLGFDKYREGVAILSRYPLPETEARYVSETNDVYSIHSRKVVMAQVQVPYMGLVNIFSAHLSWWEDGFAHQFENLHGWAAEKHDNHVVGTLLCGDFNISPGSQGYQLVMDSNDYGDQFLIANSPDVTQKIFQVNDPYWQHQPVDDYRIDYIFMHKTSVLKVCSGRVLFTDTDYGKVSDHCGYVMTFEPK